eukprot:8866428-Lingulodinium_polyedra.AAC.1
MECCIVVGSTDLVVLCGAVECVVLFSVLGVPRFVGPKTPRWLEQWRIRVSARADFAARSGRVDWHWKRLPQ